MVHEALADQIARYAADDGIHDTLIPRLSLVRWSHEGEPVHMLQRPALCIIARGAKTVIAGDQVIAYGPATHLVASLELPITGIVTSASAAEPYLCFCLYLDLPALSDLVTTLPPSMSAEAGSGLVLHPVTAELVDAATRLVALLGRPGEAAVLAPLIERELLFRLLTGATAPAMRAIANADSRIGRIARAVTWLKAHFREPFDGPALARHAGMSLSSFHEHFRGATAMTPLQYQKQLRLQDARRAMLVEGMNAADAGFRAGYDSPSQFSREYRRLFGTPPLRDMARLRQQPMVPMAI